MTYDVIIEDRQAQPAAVVRGRVTLDRIGEFVSGAFADTLAGLAAQHLAPTGPPFGRYREVDDGFEVTAGFPASATVAAAGRVEPMTLPGGTIATTVHVGSYSDLSAAYEAVAGWLAASGFVPRMTLGSATWTDPRSPSRARLCASPAGRRDQRRLRSWLQGCSWGSSRRHAAAGTARGVVSRTAQPTPPSD